MKIKAIALGATFALTALLASAADPVYSVNVVGYHKRTIPSGFSMFANQVDGATNTIVGLFPTPAVGTKIFKFVGSGFTSSEYLGAPFNTWFPDGSATLNPGEGAFIFNPGAEFTNIFAGEVLIGSLTNNLPAGFSITSSMLPQGGALASGLGLPASVGDKVFTFNAGNYTSYELLGPPFNTWFPSEPSVSVGDSFWVFKTSSAVWVRQFSVQ
jgi:hypothetical protein